MKKKGQFFIALLSVVLFSSCRKTDDPSTIQWEGHGYFEVVIYRSLSLEDLISDADFDSRDEGISETNFPIPHSTATVGDTVRGQIGSFQGTYITFPRADEHMHSTTGREMKTIDVLLAYVAKYGVTKEHPIAAIGSAYGTGANKISPGVEIKKGKKCLSVLHWENGVLHKNHLGYGNDQYFLVSK